MEIGVLGSLEILSPSGAPMPIRSAKQRELLSLLAAHVPEVVSTDRIVDALWGDGADHLPSLRFHVSKLRDALDPDRHEQLIVTKPPGYALAVGPEAVDAHRFGMLVAAAEEQATVDLARARPLLDEALGLWRGPPYAEFDYAEWARPEIVRLEELRLVAIGLRIDADLAAGRHGELVPELESLVAGSPLRETFWRQLMLALYRSGRQPEALRAYRRARDAFGEAGTAPSADLEQLERQILVRDAVLERDSPESVTAVGVPLPLSSFVGRDDEVVAIREHVATRRLVTLVGPGGVGKTRLAIEVARGLTGGFVGGIWVVALAGVDDGALVVGEVATTLGVVGGSSGALIDRVAAFVNGRHALLVMDNCEHLAGEVSTMLEVLLGSCPLLHVLVTSRTPLGMDGEVIWRTEPLPVEPERGVSPEVDQAGALTGAVRLFLDRAAEAQPSLDVTGETISRGREVCLRLAGLPLAIELAAARLRLMSLPHLCERLDDQFVVLTDGSTRAVAHHRAMRATLDWSYDLLDERERVLFRRLSVFRGGFTLETVERFHECFPSAEGDALQLVGRLVDASMVEQSPGDRLAILEPIRQYGLSLLSGHGEEHPARQCHANVFREMFRVPDSDEFGLALGGRAEEQFVTEIDNVRTALKWACESGEAATVAELGASAVCLFGSIGSLVEGNTWLGEVLTATSGANPHRARALARGVFIAAVLDGPVRAESLLDELEVTARALDDPRWRALCVERRALLALWRDDIDTAFRLWTEAAQRLLELDSLSSWIALSNHMEARFYAGDYDRAHAIALEMSDVGTRLRRPELVASSLRGRSFIAVYRGDAEGAEHYLVEAERLVGAGEFHGRVVRFDSYGSRLLPAFIALLRGDVDEAERLGATEMSNARRSRHPDMLIKGLVLMGLVHLHRGEPRAAHRFLGEGLEEARRLQMRHWQRFVLGPIAASWSIIDPPSGATLLAAVDAIDRRDHRTLAAPMAVVVEDATEKLRDSMDPDDFDEAWRRGSLMTLDRAVELAGRAGEVVTPSQDEAASSPSSG